MIMSLLMVGCQSETIKIGTLLDKTGDLGNYGPPMEVGADLAITLLTDAGVDMWGLQFSTFDLVDRLARNAQLSHQHLLHSCFSILGRIALSMFWESTDKTNVNT